MAVGADTTCDIIRSSMGDGGNISPRDIRTSLTPKASQTPLSGDRQVLQKYIRYPAREPTDAQTAAKSLSSTLGFVIP
jgi:hypothetical protein